MSRVLIHFLYMSASFEVNYLQKSYILRFPPATIVAKVRIGRCRLGRWADEDSRISYSKIIACFTARRHAVMMAEPNLVQIARRHRNS